MIISKEECEKLLSYDPNTGVFTWKQHYLPSRVGSVAGWRIKTGYVVITIKRKNIHAHRLVFLLENGALPKDDVDHINRDRSDNRRSNLRIVTRSQNMLNTVAHKDSSTGVKNVTYLNREKLFYVSLFLDGTKKSIGYFKTIGEAEYAATAARACYHGNYVNHGE